MACSEMNLKLDPSCLAKRKPGGLNRRVWCVQLEDIDAYTQDGTTKDIKTLVLKASKQLTKLVGRKGKHSGAYELQVGENVNSVKQILNLVLYHETTVDREAIMSVANAEDTVFFVQNEIGQIEVFGLDYLSGAVGDPEGGLNAESGAGGTGTLKNDDTSFKLTVAGDIRHLPPIFNISSGTLTLNIAYLDNLAGTNA